MDSGSDGITFLHVKWNNVLAHVEPITGLINN